MTNYITEKEIKINNIIRMAIYVTPTSEKCPLIEAIEDLYNSLDDIDKLEFRQKFNYKPKDK